MWEYKLLYRPKMMLMSRCGDEDDEKITDQMRYKTGRLSLFPDVPSGIDS